MEKNINGMVNQMNRINLTVNAYKFIAVVAVIAMAVVAAASFYFYSSRVAQLEGRIYILDEGATFSAHAQDESITRKDEVEDHVRTFHEFMFNLPPSMEMIRRNLDRALEMADMSAFRYYNDLQESGFYKRLTGANAYQQIAIESVEVDMSSYPYSVIVRGYQYITRETTMAQYTLVTRCKVANAVRSANNLHGLMIENFEVIDNKLVETRER